MQAPTEVKTLSNTARVQTQLEHRQAASVLQEFNQVLKFHHSKRILVEHAVAQGLVTRDRSVKFGVREYFRLCFSHREVDIKPERDTTGPSLIAWKPHDDHRIMGLRW